MTILVLGASGMAGHAVAIYLQQQGYAVDTIAGHTKLNDTTKIIDITKLDQFRNLLAGSNYDIIINCIGVLVRESVENKEKAVFLNAYLPKMLENHYENLRTRIIHISSDGVFSGSQKEYVETSPYDGQSIYSRSKALGEIDNLKDLTLRTSIIGPEVSLKESPSLFGWFYAQKGEVNGYTNSLWKGVTTIQLAKAIEAAINQNTTGIYHLVPSESISKFDLLYLFKQALHKDNLSIIPSEGQGASATLLNTRSDLVYEIPTYTDMVEEMLLWIQSHKNLYPHYSV